MLADGGYGHQAALDMLAHFFKDEADPERKALALYEVLTACGTCGGRSSSSSATIPTILCALPFNEIAS